MIRYGRRGRKTPAVLSFFTAAGSSSSGVTGWVIQVLSHGRMMRKILKTHWTGYLISKRMRCGFIEMILREILNSFEMQIQRRCGLKFTRPARCTSSKPFNPRPRYCLYFLREFYTVMQYV